MLSHREKWALRKQLIHEIKTIEEARLQTLMWLSNLLSSSKEEDKRTIDLLFEFIDE